MHSAIIRAVKPTLVAPGNATADAAPETGSCCGVTACCTPAESAEDPALTVSQAKTQAGCGCQSQS
ncbi:hypothetical protein [Acrocarpospora sp. B8E8]|uniref:hypothetical protein n=1 Tax=Acrocarpospora sp. B8E8 TaxID=3153572 RepID=UPI00325C9FA5